MAGTVLNRTTRMAESLRAIRPSSRMRGHRDLALARALLWDPKDIETKSVNQPSLKHISRANVGGQGAAVFAYAPELDTGALVGAVALYAYHASIDWGIVGNEIGLTIFNSHWVRGGSWFEIPSIRWNQIEAALDIFDALTPEGLTYGQIERVAARFPHPDEFLLPVDDALVSRLDYWRSEIARYSRDITRADEIAHRLFAQLFVLRAVEDRGLASEMGSIVSCVEDNKVNRNKVEQILSYAHRHLQSGLFDPKIAADIPEQILAGIIRDLYFPLHLPIGNARYNFAWIDADVLGRAYEKYLSQVLQPTARGTQLELLHQDQPLREIDRVRSRKATGIYYTPSFLVSYLVKECIDRQMIAGASKIPTVVDPSCGSGSFLSATVGYLIQKLRALNPRKNWGKELIQKKRICGIDSDPRAVLLARLSLWLRLAEEPSPLPLPALDETIIEGDALTPKPWKALPKEFDLVIGNPPFVPTQSIASRAELEATFETAKGRFDYSYLFLEQGIKRLKRHGNLGMVTPNRLFRNRDAGSARDFLSKNATLELVTDFGSNEVFRGVSAYIGTVVARKNGMQNRDQHSVRFTRVRKISARLMNLVLGAAARQEIATDVLESFDSPHPSGSEPWIFLSPASRSARLRLEGSSVLLSEIANVFQGIKVGANDLYIVQISGDAVAPVVSARNGLGEVFLLESDLLHPVVYGSQVEEYRRAAAQSYLVYPYLNGIPIEESRIKSQYPLTYAYLLAHRGLLESRTSIPASGRKWFELVRQRDQSLLQRPKLLMRDLAIKTAFALDELGSTFLVGGTAVVPNDSAALKPLLAYLNSKLVDWYLEPMTPSFRADFQKFEPQHISNIPVLTDLLENDEIQQKLSSWVDEAVAVNDSHNAQAYAKIRQEIDEFLCRLVGIDPSI